MSDSNGQARAQVVVDFWGFGSAGGGSTTYNVGSLEEAQEKSGALGTEWVADGWVKRGAVWVKGIDWRQKVVVYGGVEYVEADGVDE